MNTYIALLRGINVGGKHILPMKELIAVLEGLGLRNIKTYIQSGNVVFQSEPAGTAALAQDISAAIGESHGFAPQVLVLSVLEYQDALAANPFPQGENEPKTLHLYFLASTPSRPDLEALEALKTNNEQFQLIDTVFYLYAPDGIGRSKLAERVEKALGVPATARNWRTATKIMSLAADL